MVHAIAKITNTSGLRGEVKLRPLSRYSIDYIMTKDLHIGQIENNLSSLKLESKVGDGKKMKFKFQGIDSHREAENIVGKTIYIDSEKDDNINFIGENVIGFSVETEEKAEEASQAEAAPEAPAEEKAEEALEAEVASEAPAEETDNNTEEEE